MSVSTPFGQSLPLTTSWADLLTVPEGEYALFDGLAVENVDGSNTVEVSMQWLDGEGAATALVHMAPLPAKSAPLGLARGLILMSGAKLQGRASAPDDAVMVASGRLFALPGTPTPTPTDDGALDFSLDTQSGLLALLEDI